MTIIQNIGQALTKLKGDEELQKSASLDEEDANLFNISVDDAESEQYFEIVNENNTVSETQTASDNIPWFQKLWGHIVDLFDGESKDGKISDTKQHTTGDCWLLSGVNSLSYTEKGAQIIKDALDYQDGYTTVHLATGDVTVTDSELVHTKGTFQYASGDDDMIILELAVEKTLNKIENGEIELGENAPWWLEDTESLSSEVKQYGTTLEGGWAIEAIYFLTGKSGTWTEDKTEMEEQLNTFMQNGGKDYVMSASINNDGANYIIAKDTDGKKHRLDNKHAYSIKNVTSDTVTVINPWDSSEEIVLPKEYFLAEFSNTTAVDLSGDDNG